MIRLALLIQHGRNGFRKSIITVVLLLFLFVTRTDLPTAKPPYKVWLVIDHHIR